MNNQPFISWALALVVGTMLCTSMSAIAAERDLVGEINKTPLLTLDRKQTSTVSIVPVGKQRVPLRAVVTYFSAEGKRLAVRKGLVAKGAPAFVAQLAHNDIADLGPLLVRAEVKLVTTEPTATGASCPSVISMQNSDGPFLSWVSEPCACGPTKGGHVFVDCVGSGNPIIGQ